ncbi:MAG: SH3 domain-containing protein [Pseudomonadota bacterium]
MRFMLAAIGIVIATGAFADARYVAQGGTPVLSGPGTVYDTVDRLSLGTRVDVRQFYEGYALIVQRNGVEAWVPASRLSRTPPAPRRSAAAPEVTVQAVEPYASVVWTEDSPLNMRKGPGTTYDVLSQCQRGDWVQVLAKAGVWAKVEIASGKEGWVHSRYLTR